MKLKFTPNCSSLDALSDGILFFAEVKFFSFWPKTMDYSSRFDVWESKKSLEKSVPP